MSFFTVDPRYRLTHHFILPTLLHASAALATLLAATLTQCGQVFKVAEPAQACMIGCVTLFPANPLGVVPPTTSIPNTTTYVCSFNKLTRSYAIYVPSLSQSTKTYMNMHKGDYHGFLSAQPTPSMHSCLFSLLVLILAVQYCQNMHSLLTLTLSVMLALLSVGHTHLSHQITQIDNHNDNHKDQHKHDAHNLQMSKT